jgi:hypothetical protein
LGRVLGYTTELYCVSCEVQTEFINVSLVDSDHGDFFFVEESGRLCCLVVRVLDYRSGGPGSIPGNTRKKKVVGLERGTLSLVITTEELLDRKAAAPV